MKTFPQPLHCRKEGAQFALPRKSSPRGPAAVLGPTQVFSCWRREAASEVGDLCPPSPVLLKLCCSFNDLRAVASPVPGTQNRQPALLVRRIRAYVHIANHQLSPVWPG